MIVSLIFSVASGFVVAKFGNLRPTTMGTMVTTLGFFVLFMYHSEASIAAVLVIVAPGLALMQIGSVNVVLTSTPKQFSGISLGMNLLILPYRILLVGPIIADIYMQANQIFVESETGSNSPSFPSPES
jgi:hypothetical protein